MGIRQTLNEKKNLTIAVTSVVILLTIIIIIWELMPSRPQVASGPRQEFYSDDEGQTFFADEADKVTPFDHNGKPAVRAFVYRCGSGAPFVVYLQRYTVDGKKKAEAMKQKGISPRRMVSNANTMSEVKKPGNQPWVKWSPTTASAWATIMRPVCPDGSSTPIPVLPGQEK